MKLRYLTMLVFGLAALALGACGGGSDSNSQDEDDITAAITRAATSGDPAACTDSQTAKFNEQTSGGGGDPVKNCEEDAANTAADSVDVSNIEVDGDSATAEISGTGSILDGQTLNVALIKEGDQWKLDELQGFTDFDRDAFIEAFSSELDSEGDVPAEASSCLKQQFQNASDEELQNVLLTPEGGQSLFQPCFS
jgi:hypothetical protein